MALFGKKKNTEEKKAEVKEAPVKKVIPVKKVSSNVDLSWVIIRPRITEKGAVVATDSNAYTFDVSPRATKFQIKAAISQIYKVNPIKVCIAQIPDKKVRVRGQRRKTGIKSGGKKAFVYLKKGDRIEFV